MANISCERRGKRILYRAFFRDERGNRKSVRLAGVTKRGAEAVAVKLQAIVSSRITGAPLPDEVSHWLAKVDGELRDKLVQLGMATPRQRFSLDAYVEHFIERKPTISERTATNLRQTKKQLINFLGNVDLKDISPEQAQAFRRKLEGKYSQASVSAHVKRARQFFRQAVRDNAIAASPFAEVVAGADDNAARKHYVKASDVELLIAEAPDSDWRCLLALSRYGGLRTPSESLRLKWSDIDWHRGRMRVESPKTTRHGRPFREVPLFPELESRLAEAYDQAPEGSVYVIQRYRDQDSNLRTHLLRLIKRAGLTPWPRLWHNLRASRSTDLVEVYPSHVAAAWLGHTEAIADRNYRQVKAEHFTHARGGAGGGAATARNEQNPVAGDRSESREKQTSLVFAEIGEAIEYPRVDSNH